MIVSHPLALSHLLSHPLSFVSLNIAVSKALGFPQAAAKVLTITTLVQQELFMRCSCNLCFVCWWLLIVSTTFAAVAAECIVMPGDFEISTVRCFPVAISRRVTCLQAFQSQPQLRHHRIYFIICIILCAAMDRMIFSKIYTSRHSHLERSHSSLRPFDISVGISGMLDISLFSWIYWLI